MPFLPNRNTKYEAFAIGAVDPNYKHIWAFRTPAERETMLAKHTYRTYENNAYWKPGDRIQIDASTEQKPSFEASFEVDYVRITNRLASDAEQIYYCFVVQHRYVNLNLTELTLEIDYLQTYFFNADGSPFWLTSGYGVSTTNRQLLPMRGMPAEYPALRKRNLWEWHNDENVSYIFYSAIDINAKAVPIGGGDFSLEYDNPFRDGGDPASGLIDQLFMGAVPYIIEPKTVTLPDGRSADADPYSITYMLNNELNASGQLGSITGAYAVPKNMLPTWASDYVIWSPQLLSNYQSADFPDILVTVPYPNTLLTGETINNPALLGYDYIKIKVTNQLGEEQYYSYEDFNGQPQFKLKLSLAAGYPIICLVPINYKFGSVDVSRQFAMKQTLPPQCSLQSDNYAIWQAQNRNSIQANIDSANLTLANAKEAQAKSGGIATLLDNAFDKAAGQTDSILQQLGLTLPDDIKNAMTTAGYSGLNGLLSMGMLSSFGLEASYVYNQQVAVASQAIKSLEASYEDQKYTPATAQGSNAYGDLMSLKQFGFSIQVIGPSAEDLSEIDKTMDGAGHQIKGEITVTKDRPVFDYYRILDTRITNAVYNRPAYVNNLMVEKFSDGLYLWYVQADGDIDIADFKHPYGVTNV